MRERQRWELMTLLRTALALEGRGDWDGAVAQFQQVIEKSPYNDIGKQAQEHVQAIQEKHPRQGEA